MFYIDLSKGFCILLVLMVHALTDYVPGWTLYIMLPLFFIVSGMFFRDYGGKLNFLSKKLNKIAVPALFFYTLSYILLSVNRAIKHETIAEGNYFDFIFLNQTTFNGTLWFLFCLFNINLIFYIFHVISRGKNWVLCILCFAAGFAGYQLSINETRLVLYLDISLTVLPFFYVGWFIAKHNILNLWNRWMTFVIGIVSLLGLIIYYQFDNSNWILYHQNYMGGVPLITFLMSCIAVIAFIFITKIVQWLPVISFFGRYSLIVLCTNTYAVILADKLAERGSIINFLIVILLSWCLIIICRYYLPYFTAQNDIKLRFWVKENYTANQ